MTTLMIAVAAMTVGAAVGFLTARLICGTDSSVQRSPYMSSRADMYRQRAADAKQRAAQAKDPSIKIAFEHEAAFWRALAEQLDWIGREEVSPPRRKIIAKPLHRQTYVRSKIVTEANCGFGLTPVPITRRTRAEARLRFDGARST
jgi:hypothetical protein